ncbi:MAG: co-chaperone GroES [Planctomycetes bacterium]|nr:co-chaperone GroES [Planctomycetota bacterium]
MKTKVKPLGERVIIERMEAEGKSSGGILLPDSAKEKPQQGKVLAVGPGALLKNGKRNPLDVKVGDTVLFGKYAGTEVKIGNEEFTILKESDILAITG